MPNENERGFNLIFCSNVEDILHVKLEGVGSPGADDSGSFVDLEAAAGSVSDDEVVDVVVGVGVSGLEGEHGRVGRRVQLHHRLHGQRPVDEVRRLIVHVLHVNDDALVVRV